MLVSASVDPFIPEGAVYRLRMDEHSPLVKIAGGLPEWLGGKVDTGCIAVNGSAIAMADMSGSLYVSSDTGLTWSRWEDGIPMPSGVLSSEVWGVNTAKTSSGRQFSKDEV